MTTIDRLEKVVAYLIDAVKYHRHGGVQMDINDEGQDKLNAATNLLLKDNTGPTPWLQPGPDGELPGGICCQRATGKHCYEHDPANWKSVDGMWVLKDAEVVDLSEPCARYRYEYHYSSMEQDGLWPNPEGEWVKYDEVAKRLEELEALTGAHEECNRMTGVITGLRDELTVVKAKGTKLSAALRCMLTAVDESVELPDGHPGHKAYLNMVAIPRAQEALGGGYKMPDLTDLTNTKVIDTSSQEMTPQNVMEETFCSEYPDAVKTFGRVQAGSMLAVFRVAWETRTKDLNKERMENRRLAALLDQCRVILTKALHVLQASQDMDLIKEVMRLIKV
jgi:hypothetical protein